MATDSGVRDLARYMAQLAWGDGYYIYSLSKWLNSFIYGYVSLALGSWLDYNLIQVFDRWWWGKEVFPKVSDDDLEQ